MRKNICFGLLLVLFMFVLFPFAWAEERTAGTQPESSNNSDTYRQLNLFGDVFERVRDQYVEPVEDKALIENALNGMLTSLDPHSGYMNEKEFEEMQIKTKGEFGGLGIEVTMENGFVKVVSPIDDTPAFRAGVKPGDFITHIDSQPVLGLSLNQAVEKMRGDVGSTVELTFVREGTPDPFTLKIKRDIIRIDPVRHRTEGNAGYIRITTFNQNTYSELELAITEIEKKLGPRLIGYVLDLRNNPGGLLDQAIAVSDAFLEQGEIVSTRGRDETDTKRDNATPGDLSKGLPLVVLINDGSASASEIVAGALQDHKRAILLGTKSFGKGSVQTVIPLPSHGAMRLTTARYYTPSGRSIQALGIEPDILVEPAKIETLKNHANLSEADLPHALDKQNGQKKDQAEQKQSTLPPELRESKVKPDPNDPSQDYQLARALDLLNGLSLYSGGMGFKSQQVEGEGR